MLQSKFHALLAVLTTIIAISTFAAAAIKQPASVNHGASAPQRTSKSAINGADSAVSSDVRLARRAMRVLDSYYAQPLNTRDDAPWSLLHWGIAYGVDAKVSLGQPLGRQVTAIGWLCSNYPAKGIRLMGVQRGEIHVPVAPGLQGHDAQFLSMLAQSRVNRDYPVRIDDRQLAVADLVEYEKRTCRSDMELTFKLIGITHYEGSDATWKSANGESWSVEKILAHELQEPIDRKLATCGGTHRLFAINFAVERRRLDGLPIEGPWLQAVERTEHYQRRAFQLQNRDGSFSTSWFDGPEQDPDIIRRLLTSGHILEYLAYSLPDDQLQDPRFRRGVEFVIRVLESKQHMDWHRGALGHALHALAIYEEHILGVQPGDRSDRLARAD